nr:Rv3654c family TadE-like protein [Micromonospora pisi]
MARDRGSASLWLLAVGLTLVMAGMAGAAVGAARVAKHQARVAADFGALAGAARTLEGPAVACARAADLVSANGGRIVDCAVDGLDLQLVVELTAHPLPGLTRVARATARAGPIRA